MIILRMLRTFYAFWCSAVHRISIHHLSLLCGHIAFQTLKGGSGNVVYKCRCSDQDDRRAILVRVYGQFSPKLFRPNPRSALWVMRFLAYRGCCGKVLCQFTNGLVYEYTTGQQLTFDGAKDPITKRSASF